MSEAISRKRMWTGVRSAAAPRDPYDRRRDLPSLLPLQEEALVTTTAAEQLALLGLIRRALRRERVRGLGNHWCYDVGRHAALLSAYRAEVGLAHRMLQDEVKRTGT